MQDLFVELLQVALSIRGVLSRIPTTTEWYELYNEAQRHAVVGVLLHGVERLPEPYRPPQLLMLQWIGVVELMRSRNQTVNERCFELQSMFIKDGFECCILKGQGCALLYPDPWARQSGDIDVWVKSIEGKGIKGTVDYLASKCGFDKLHVVYHHTVFPIWDDVEVEVHWRPSWRSSPFYNRRLQRWFSMMSEAQFKSIDKQTGLQVPTLEFNAVYLLQHMFLHVFQEGLGFRQVIDYYYLLVSDKRVSTPRLQKTIRYLGLYDFACAVMFVLRHALGLEERYLIVPVDEKRGRFLLDEIFQSGNFGQYDERNRSFQTKIGTRRSIGQLRRKLRFIKDYPVETLSGPLQIRNVIWRKLKLWKWE